MMPGSDFKDCLDTPHLAKDAAAAAGVSANLAQAQELFQTATDRMKDGWDGADITLLCYRSMYSAAKALVQSEGYRCTNFRCLIVALQELFVRPKRIDQDLVGRLVAAQEVTGEAAVNLKAAENFIAKAKELA